MRYNALALPCLSVPLLSQAGPVQSISHHSSDLGLEAIDRDPGALVSRAEEDACDDTGRCKDNGRTLWDALLAKLKDPNAEDENRYDDLFKNDYNDNDSRDTSPDANAWRELFKEKKLDYDKHFAQHAVIAKDEGSTLSYVNMFNTNQGVMISPYNFKNHDKKQTVPLSEVIFQCYKKETDEVEELKLFQFAGVNTMIEPTYEKVIWDIYKKRGRPLLHQKWEKWTFEENEEDFLAFLGTPKLSYVLRMLTAHSVAFGKRIPTEVWTNRRGLNAYVVIGKYKE
ncbi:MAG: hypothetical protein Q9226_001392 [Calogaya cf. arnoldii]